MVLLLLGVGEKEIKHVLRVVCVVVNYFFFFGCGAVPHLEWCSLVS